jgi:hypothetical protein
MRVQPRVLALGASSLGVVEILRRRASSHSIDIAHLKSKFKKPSVPARASTQIEHEELTGHESFTIVRGSKQGPITGLICDHCRWSIDLRPEPTKEEFELAWVNAYYEDELRWKDTWLCAEDLYLPDVIGAIKTGGGKRVRTAEDVIQIDKWENEIEAIAKTLETQRTEYLSLKKKIHSDYRRAQTLQNMSNQLRYTVGLGEMHHAFLKERFQKIPSPGELDFDDPSKASEREAEWLKKQAARKGKVYDYASGTAPLSTFPKPFSSPVFLTDKVNQASAADLQRFKESAENDEFMRALKKVPKNDLPKDEKK